MAGDFYVSDWMEDAGQEVPHTPTSLTDSQDHFRKSLINEEYIEYLAAEGLRDQIKELCDLIVVTVGTLVSMGVEVDVVMDIIMKNNFKKLKHKQVREDGKIIVPKEVKKKLKEEVELDIQNYILYRMRAA